MGAISQGLGSTVGRRRRKVSKWVRMAVHMGRGPSRDTQFRYVEMLFISNMMVSWGKFLRSFKPWVLKFTHCFKEGKAWKQPSNGMLLELLKLIANLIQFGYNLHDKPGLTSSKYWRGAWEGRSLKSKRAAAIVFQKWGSERKKIKNNSLDMNVLINNLYTTFLIIFSHISLKIIGKLKFNNFSSCFVRELTHLPCYFEKAWERSHWVQADVERIE